MRTPVFAASIAPLALASLAAASTAPGEVPLPSSVVASAMIRAAMEHYEQTGHFFVPPEPEPAPCYPDYHPMEHELWDLRPWPSPECPNGADPSECLLYWFGRWRSALSQVHSAWSDAYCNCKCCYDEAGFASASECIRAMEEIFAPEFQLVRDRYYSFNSGRCCPVER